MKWLRRLFMVGWWLAVASVLYDVWDKISWGEYAVVVVLVLESVAWHFDTWAEEKEREQLSERMNRAWRR